MDHGQDAPTQATGNPCTQPPRHAVVAPPGEVVFDTVGGNQVLMHLARPSLWIKELAEDRMLC